MSPGMAYISFGDYHYYRDVDVERNWRPHWYGREIVAVNEFAFFNGPSNYNYRVSTK